MKAESLAFCLPHKKFRKETEIMIKFQNAATSSVFVLPRDVEKHLKNAGAAELRVLLHIFACSGVTENKAQIAQATGITESQVYEALAFWRGAGIITYSKEQPAISVVSETPASQRSVSYSSAEIADAINGSEDVRSLLNFASQKLGKLLTPNEQAGIYSLVDSLGLECDLVMGIIEYCVSMDKKSVKYIERTAAKMRDEDGIDTYAKFEEYMERKAEQNTYEQKIRRIIGAHDRGFTKKESAIIAEFASKNVSDELIEAAYDRTINSISKPSLSYMSKIIENWLSKGITSPEQLEGDKPFDGGDSSMAAFRFEDFLEGPGVTHGSEGEK